MFPEHFVRWIIDPIRCKLNSYHERRSKVVKSLQQTQWWSREQLVELQQRKLQKLCKAAYYNTTYYKKRLDQVGIDPAKITISQLHKLPVLDRTDIRENFSEIINKRMDYCSLIKRASGGSTGEPVHILLSPHAASFNAAITDRNNSWTGFLPGKEHHKFWGAVHDLPDEHEPLRRRYWRSIYNQHHINAFKASDELFQEYYEVYRNRPPFLIESYVNILYEFAKFIEINNLEPLHPKAVISSAGTLYDFQRTIIERSFGPVLFNRYGCREMGNIAHECYAHTHMHINMERYLLEIVQKDEQGVGEILVTDLENLGFPLLRYRIGDLGKLSDIRCDCGRDLDMLEKVVGRTADVVVTPDGRKVSGELFVRLFRTFEQIIWGQVARKSLRGLEIRLQVSKPLTSDEQKRLVELATRYVGKEMHIWLRFVNQVTVTGTGKYRPVVDECIEMED